MTEEEMQQKENSKRDAMETPWMTVDEIAKYLSVSPGTIKNWVSQKYIPFARRGRVIRFHKSKIDKWLSTGSCDGRVTIAQKLSRS